MSDYLVISEELEPGIARLTFNRPEKMNALSMPMLLELNSHINALENDHTTRAVIITGAGEKAFVAGADIAGYQGNRTPEFISYQLESRRIFDKLEALSKPTIAAIRGYALGGGFEIALCCDLIICTTSARLGLPEGLLGLSPGGGGSQRLTRAVGRYVASDIMLTARRISGDRAFQLGLAVECVTDDMLMETALIRARSMLKVAPLAQAQMKRLIRQGQDAALPVAQDLEQEILFRLYGTRDGQEGIDAFLDKRDPHFKGQ